MWQGKCHAFWLFCLPVEITKLYILFQYQKSENPHNLWFVAWVGLLSAFFQRRAKVNNILVTLQFITVYVYPKTVPVLHNKDGWKNCNAVPSQQPPLEMLSDLVPSMSGNQIPFMFWRTSLSKHWIWWPPANPIQTYRQANGQVVDA
jgi:hypothetical protein